MAITVFTDMFNSFDQSVLQTINTGSANLISLISPLASAGFSMYVLIVLIGYWRGRVEQPFVDFVWKCIGWAFVLTAGMNISYYTQYVVPFFNGFGDDISSALTNGPPLTSGLDNLLTLYLTSITTMFSGLGYDVGLYVEMAILALLLLLVGGIFLAIAAAFIILAKFSLGLLLALGPMFIVAGLFPATSRFFDNWIGQCVNYGILVALFSALGAIEVTYATSIIPHAFTPASVLLTWTLEAKIVASGFVFIIISLNLPSMASQLAGGVGLSAMTGKVAGAARSAAAVMKAATKVGRSGADGGSLSGS
ncbi:conjugal transfer protein TrbL [Burkholderia territorii]|uniref:type IV secretion system protein n=1 Tax=Burkholderia territorii TaxID=1503055 RepID=UPI0007565DD3|nr:type IV secretion system protein [Burkholderia territorii]KVL25464.1 conjugal transfer protein TrbL [Burkholderia territorii]